MVVLYCINAVCAFKGWFHSLRSSGDKICHSLKGLLCFDEAQAFASLWLQACFLRTFLWKVSKWSTSPSNILRKPLEKWLFGVMKRYLPTYVFVSEVPVWKKIKKMNRGRPSHTALDPTVWNQSLFISHYWLNWRSTCRPTGTPTNVSHPLHSSPLMCTCLSFISFHLSLFIELNHRHECAWLWCDAQPSINPYLPHCSSPS